MGQCAVTMRMLALLLILMAAGCGHDISGHWCGKLVESDAECTGDDLGMLLITQTDENLSGQACESQDHDCHVMEKGRIDGADVTFHYSFAGGYVDAALTVDDNVMTGKLYASKCDCHLPYTFYRIP
jgi:hypothetical protein